MSAYMMVIVVLLPILAGALVSLIPFKTRTQMMVYIESVVLLNSVLVLALLFHRPEEAFVLFRFTGNLSISFRLDGLGTVFAGILAVLWPLATLYSFEYMKHEGHEKFFFMFYVITFGVTLGIALAEDILTMYFFYEMLTLVTLPLIMHTLSREAILASRTYLYYSLGGAAFAFIGMIFILTYGTTSVFVPGGVLDMAALGEKKNLLLLIHVAVLGLASEGGRGAYAGNGAASCGGCGKGGGVYDYARDLLQLWYRTFEGDLGAICGDGACNLYDRIWMQPGFEGDAYEKASGMVYGQQPVLYPVWRGADDASWTGGGAVPYGISCGDEDLFLLLCGCGDL